MSSPCVYAACGSPARGLPSVRRQAIKIIEHDLRPESLPQGAPRMEPPPRNPKLPRTSRKMKSGRKHLDRQPRFASFHSIIKRQNPAASATNWDHSAAPRQTKASQPANDRRRRTDQRNGAIGSMRMKPLINESLDFCFSYLQKLNSVLRTARHTQYDNKQYVS